MLINGNLVLLDKASKFDKDIFFSLLMYNWIYRFYFVLIIIDNLLEKM